MNEPASFQLSGCFLRGEKARSYFRRHCGLRISDSDQPPLPIAAEQKTREKGTSSTFWLASDLRNIANSVPHCGFVPLCCILPWLAPTYSEEVVAS